MEIGSECVSPINVAFLQFLSPDLRDIADMLLSNKGACHAKQK